MLRIVRTFGVCASILFTLSGCYFSSTTVNDPHGVWAVLNLLLTLIYIAVAAPFIIFVVWQYAQRDWRKEYPRQQIEYPSFPTFPENWRERKPLLLWLELASTNIFKRVQLFIRAVLADRKIYLDWQAVRKVERDKAAYENSLDGRQMASYEARREQIQAFLASVPKEPPERIRATIEVHQVYQWIYMEWDGTGKRETKAVINYSVDMVLQSSETYQATIKQQQLGQIVIDKQPRYRSDQILDTMSRYDEETEKLNRGGRDFTALVFIEMHKQEKRSYESYAGETMLVRLRDYFNVPYSCVFSTRPEADAYTDKLRNQILPAIRDHVEAALKRRDISRSVEL